jgi:transposase-like protein
MPLSIHLTNAVMSHTCPNCCFNLQRTGGWFRALRQQYVCQACKKPVTFGYSEKLKLFDDHAQLKPA